MLLLDGAGSGAGRLFTFEYGFDGAAGYGGAAWAHGSELRSGFELVQLLVWFWLGQQE